MRSACEWTLRGVVAIAAAWPLAATAQSPAGLILGNDRPAPQVNLRDTLYDVLAVGPTSPAGVSAEGLDPAELATLAQEAMAATPPNPEEADYWLRRIVVSALTAPDRNVPWALETLAKRIYERDGESAENMRRVELIWQLMAVAGQGDAMCNIGYIHMSATGVPKNTRLARQWYERAQAAGCSQARQALAELGR